jgi:sigma-E factor negative regulatory protein RseC
MIEEQALVVSVEKIYPHDAWVKTQRQSSCGSCEGKSACGTQVLSKVIGQRSNTVKVLNPTHAKAGDFVIIGIDEKALLSGSFYLYFLPLVGMIIFSLLGTVLSTALNLDNATIDFISIVYAVLGFLSGVWLTRKKITSRSKHFQATIVRILNPKPTIIDSQYLHYQP